MKQKKSDQPVALFTVFIILALSLFLQSEFNTRQALLFLVGAGLGVSLFHAMFGFTGGWRFFIRDRKSAGIRAQLILLGLSAILFFPVIAGIIPGVNASAALGQVGVSVLAGAFLFGIGMQLGGGCGSGTLFTVGQGQTDMLITISFFIIGSTIGSYHLGWWLGLPNLGKISMINSIGWLPALVITLGILAVLYKLVTHMENRRHSSVQELVGPPQQDFFDTLIHGPWPLWWGVIGLAVFGLLTLLLAGYPWSITFAFGLWGAKIWSALGGDVTNWAYWSAGYPARALSQSVLADMTSVMNFGIILGAMLAAALQNKYAPAGKINSKRVVTAVIGGLLLGYGARLAFGCNIGALLGGVASGSVHAWLWAVAAFVGGIAGVNIRVKMNLDKPYR